MLHFSVENMSCGHCVRSITAALQALDPQAQVRIDLARGELDFTGQLSIEQVLETLKAQGYPAVPRNIQG